MKTLPGPERSAEESRDSPQSSANASVVSLVTITRTTAGPGLPSGFPFSLAAAAQGLCFISGMPSLDPDGAYAAGSFTDELELAWQNVLRIADAAGYAKHDLLYVQCVLADIGDYGELNQWWRKQFPDVSAAPARFTFQAGGLPFGAKIELQAVASIY